MKVKLCDVFDLQMGKTPSRDNLEYWNGEHKWVAIGDLGNTGKYISSTKERISDAGVAGSGIKPVPAGTVIMSFKLSIGKTAITAEEIYTNEAIMAFIDKKVCPIDVGYIYHLFNGMDWSEGSNRAVMGITLNKATLSQKTINIPDINEQKSVTRVLDKLDDLISLRKQQLSKLDELVKVRFWEMFGDPSKNNKEWTMRSFQEICTVRQGLQIPISKRLTQFEENCYEYITVAYLHGSKEREYIKNPKSTVICTKDDILMTRTGNTGMVVTDVSGVFHNNFFLIDFDRTRYKKNFLTQYLNLETIQTEIRQRAGTSTIPDLNHGEFYKIPIYEPPIELQEQFSSFVEQTNKFTLTIRQSLDKLEVLKGSLMQEYFGGL